MATAAASSSLKTASVLAFERKLDPSDALLFSGLWDARRNADATHWQPLKIQTKSVRGTISNRLKTKDQDPAKLDAAIQNPNLQTVDFAALPDPADTLKVAFSLRVLGGTGTPSACNNLDYQNKLINTVQSYANAHGFKELALRYAHNLANGRFLWRNRMGAEQIEVQVQHIHQGQPINTWTFNGLDFSLREFSDFSRPASTPINENLQQLSELMVQGLSGKNHVLLHITAFARIGAGQEIYPSQELILDKGNSKDKKSKTLYQVQNIAGIHSQKIGNALRTIDTWHQEASTLGPIAVEPYGSVTTLGKACRRPGEKEDFYNLLDNWILKDRTPTPEQQHFVIATLVRGGVFGDAGKDKD
jgi:CRISPR-associated protein Csy3